MPALSSVLTAPVAAEGGFFEVVVKARDDAFVGGREEVLAA